MANEEKEATLRVAASLPLHTQVQSQWEVPNALRADMIVADVAVCS